MIDFLRRLARFFYLSMLTGIVAGELRMGFSKKSVLIVFNNTKELLKGLTPIFTKYFQCI
jgi:hypothetical protein